MTESELNATLEPSIFEIGAARPLHIVITSPFVWPWVRRGSERLLYDLSRYLADRGHRVSVFSSGPDDGAEDREGIAYRLLKQRFHTGLRQFNGLHHFAFCLQKALRHCAPDVVFSLNYFDAYAALRARRRSGARYPVIFHSAGIPTWQYFRAVPLDAWFFRTVLREASERVAVSQYAGDIFQKTFGCPVVVLAPPVTMDQFSPATGESSRTSSSGTRIMFVGDADVPRKGARALCRALPLVRQHFPDARLVFAGQASAATQESLLLECGRSGTAEQVEFLGVGSVKDLPALYRSADVTALPSVSESFGMVLVESLASGTPAVAARHGGATEILDEDLVGQLFDPGEFVEQTDNIGGLAQALISVLTRGKTPEVVAACRVKAGKFSWSTLGPEYERLLHRAVAAQ